MEGKQRMSNIKDVAKLAGVSVGTVSRYLNTPDLLKPDTRSRVENAITALNYQPNLFARNLRTQNSKTIALLTENVSNPFYEQMFMYIREAASSLQYNLVLFSLEDNHSGRVDYFSASQEKYLSGMIICSFQHEFSYIDQILSNHDFPTVLISDQSATLNTSAPEKLVYAEFEPGFSEATEKMIQLGFSDFVYVGAPGHGTSDGNDKLAGVQHALQKNGLPPAAVINTSLKHNFSDGYQAGVQIAALRHRPDIVITDADVLTVGVLRAFADKGVHVPEDIAILSCDDTFLSQYAIPRISSIHIPTRQMAEKAFSLLISQINKEEADITGRAFHTTCILRESTGTPAI